MITPLTMSYAEFDTASDEELVDAYVRDGRTKAEAEAYVAAVRGDGIVD
ncbi:hypothetical protein [Aeromicrobium sp.]